MLSFTTNGNFIDFKYTEDQYPFYSYLVFKLHNTSRAISWAYNDNPNIITFTVDESKYEEIPITSIYFDGVQMSAQADFETGIEAMFPGYAGGGGGSGVQSVSEGQGISVDNTDAVNPIVKLPYKSYVSTLIQTGTDAPIANVFTDTTGFGNSWTYNNVGNYSLSWSVDGNKLFVSGVALDGAGEGTEFVISLGAGRIVLRILTSGLSLLSQDGSDTQMELGDLLIGNIFCLPEIRLYDIL